MNKLHELGSFNFRDQIDITDPCYDKDVWCRTKSPCKPGTYIGFALEQTIKNWGDRIVWLGMYHSSLEEMPSCNIELPPIGVDAGLAGFFDNKPDYGQEEWERLCNEEFCVGKDCGQIDCGFWSSSGIGDGEYEVWAHANEKGERDAFEIFFY